MANDSPRFTIQTLTQKPSAAVSKESQFIVLDIDFYSGPVPFPFLLRLIMRISHGFRRMLISRMEKQLAFEDFACLPLPDQVQPFLPKILSTHSPFFIADCCKDFVVLIFGSFIASTQVRTSICLRKCEKCGN